MRRTLELECYTTKQSTLLPNSSSHRKHRHSKGVHPEHLITVTTTRQLPKRPGRNLQLALLSARSVRNKAADITEYVSSGGIDVCLLTET